MQKHEDENKNISDRRIIHGWVSLWIIAAILFIGLLSIQMHSAYFSIVFVMSIVAGFSLVLFAFCAKCPCGRTGCRHIVFGPIALKMFIRKEGRYVFTDILLTTIGGMMILLFPLYWLIKTPLLLFIFLLLILLLVFEVGKNICKTCKNHFCPCFPSGKKGTTE